jgi:hypothetical protein
MATHPVLDTFFPWNRWPRFVVRLLTTTLPAHYPGRATAIYQLGDLGQQAQNQIGGALPPWEQGIVPSMRGYFSSGSAETFGSVAGYAPPDFRTPNGRLDFSDLAFSNPALRSAAYVVTGRDPVNGHVATDQYGRAVRASDPSYPPDPNSGKDTFRLALSELANMVWPLRVAFGSGDPADTSVPLPGLQQQHKPRSGAPHTSQPWEVGLWNAVSPIKYHEADLPADAKRGADALRENLQRAAKASASVEYNKLSPAGKIEYYQKHGAVENTKVAAILVRLADHPDELQRILREGTRGS